VLSLCLSRACLDKTIVFKYKWRKKWRAFAPVRTTACCSCARAPRSPQCRMASRHRRYPSTPRWLSQALLPPLLLLSVSENASLFECFLYVCPEPVLVKRSFFSIKWRKKTRFPHRRRRHPHRCQRPAEKTPFMRHLCTVSRSSNFPYDCPEPVLANIRVFSTTWRHYCKKDIPAPPWTSERPNVPRSSRLRRSQPCLAASPLGRPRPSCRRLQ